jgi:hypothetical protein
MATTNAAINQTNNALKKLTTAANAQANAEAGRNVTQNLTKMNQATSQAAAGLEGAANKMIKLNFPNIANKLKSAARNAEAAATAKAAQNATQALNMLRTAMAKNLTQINQGKPPVNAAGIV